MSLGEKARKHFGASMAVVAALAGGSGIFVGRAIEKVDVTSKLETHIASSNKFDAKESRSKIEQALKTAGYNFETDHRLAAGGRNWETAYIGINEAATGKGAGIAFAISDTDGKLSHYGNREDLPEFLQKAFAEIDTRVHQSQVASGIQRGVLTLNTKHPGLIPGGGG
jgi:hypothetical protein